MTRLTQQYKDHALTPGTRVIRLTGTRAGKPFSRLYLYETGAAFAEDGLDAGFMRMSEEWDGTSDVSVYAGD